MIPRKTLEKCGFKDILQQSLAQCQEDPIIFILHIWIDENKKPNRDEIASLKPALRKYWLNWDNITKKGGVLYQKWNFPDVEKAPCLQFLVRKVLQKEILTHCHNSTYAARLGIEKTKAKIKQRFYWYRMGTDIVLHIRLLSWITELGPQWIE